MKQQHATLLWRLGTITSLMAIHVGTYSNAIAATGFVALAAGTVATALIR
jgi:hypothetical protein